MRTTKHLISTCIPAAAALAVFALAATVASADTVDAIYNSAADVPITANGYTATGNTVNFTLNYAPALGTELTVVSNTALDSISGTFDNLTNGQTVVLSHGGTNYVFAANYYGGSGNDLVLVWANNRAFAWGLNNYGQLGDNTWTNRVLPVLVTATGVLAGKTLVAIAGGANHSLALCSDGTVAAWGLNQSGQLGDNLVSGDRSLVPVAVNTASGVSALFGKTVVAVAAGANHSLALCSDGTVAAWGYNGYGQLGESGVSSLVPVAVNTASGVSALYGKTVVAIAAGENHSLALCSDGTVAAWGYNNYGQLGDNQVSGPSSLVAVAVNTASGVSALFGKTVVAVAAGANHSLALCSDGTVAAWGYNGYGQLGDNTVAYRLVPVAVNTASGLSSLFGKTVVAIAAGWQHSLARCSDGSLAAWGYNYYGQLGDNSTTSRPVPVAVDTTPLVPGERFTRVSSGPMAVHTLAVVAAAPPEINVTGNGLSVLNSDTTPRTEDGTDFGSALAGGGTVVRTFMVQNTGRVALNLTGTPRVVVSGPQATDFTVTLQPASPVAGGGTTTFQVTFAPSAGGTRTATLSITNDDSDESLFSFVIQGAGSDAVLDATYTTGSEVPLTVSGLVATGITVNFTLNHVPAAGTELMVVSNTGLNFISGTFDNLTNGQPVALSYGGTNYSFVANYYGGSGNDLVLVWAINRAFAWGNNNLGQLGDNTSASLRLLPVPVTATGVLAGKTVLAAAAGAYHSLALCSDGTVAAWGLNAYGQLGDNTTTNRLVPVRTVPGRSKVVAIAAGGDHSLALRSDGTMTAWGNNQNGQLGDKTTATRLVPVAVNTASGVSALYGKTVVAIAAGWQHSLALCSDGTVVAWGLNDLGQLGDNTTTNRLVPVAVNTASGISALFGKTVVAIAAGNSHNLALCSDGTVAAWGDNDSGRLGDNTTTNRLVPMVVNTASGSALFGRTVVAIAAGGAHSLARCSDSTVAAWGWNYYGQLGDNTWPEPWPERHVPVAVNRASGSALFGKTVVAIAAGANHSLALCSDGTAAAWGSNGSGQLGDNTPMKHNVPVAVNTTSLAAGQRFTCVASGSVADHTLAVVAGLPPEINLTGNGVSILDGETTPGTADGTDFGSALPGSGTAVRTFMVQNTGSFPLNLTGTPKVAVSGPQAVDFTVTIQPDSPVAAGGTTTFQVTFAPSGPWLRAATLTITNDDSDESVYSFAIQGTGTSGVNATYTTGSEVPLTVSGLAATGSTVNFTLNYTPAAGTELMVVSNTGLNFINGTFDNLTNGQTVTLRYGGTNYNFVANYYGGSGNDLVLVWAYNRVFAWGNNSIGQLGDNTGGTNRLLPVAVTATGVLAGKTVVALAAGQVHSLALCLDGTVAAWGDNGYGELGDSQASGSSSLVPVSVNTASGVSALHGKTVVAIAAGYAHSLALCSDGTVAAWGQNGSGQLGDNTTMGRTAPVAVNTASGVSALYGKTVVAIAAGSDHSLALCSDGTVATWGENDLGQLGDNTTTNRMVPIAVNVAPSVSALRGKKVVAIVAGYYHSLALCSDGAVAAWGFGAYGQLGDNATAQRNAPVAVNTASGVSALYGKTVVAIAASYSHSLARCSDGTVAAWGYNGNGQIGDNTTTPRYVPVVVNTASGISALYDKTAVAVAAGDSHSLALCSDGTGAAWGENDVGQLGDNTTTQRNAPVMVDTTPLAPGERFTVVTSSSVARHTLALVASPPPQINVTGNGVSILNGDATPGVEDGTDFGSALAGGGTVVRTFTIQNTGLVALNLTGTPKAAVSGPHAADFVVTLQPASPVVSGGTTTFQVTFTPSASGTRTAILTIANDDTARNPYLFAIQGTGVTVLSATYTTGSEVPLTVSGLTATGNTVNLTLNYAPVMGTELMVVSNTGLSFINGTFDNFTNGQMVVLSYAGTNYVFAANYYGGSGNDLVLVWAYNRPFAWGLNNYGQIGDNTSGINRLLPVPVTATGVLAGRTVVAVAAGASHSLALCSDGTVAAWGSNGSGQLGDNTTTNRLVPVGVNTASGVSALYGKTVVAIAAGASHSLALCSDGTVAAWGGNGGRLGDNQVSGGFSLVPVGVNTASGVSALYGKTVVAIAAGSQHSLALCSDGTVAAWGGNGAGQLGDNTTTIRFVPVGVSTASGVSALFGKTVVAVAAGATHSLALCSDGTVAAWGDNGAGQLGDNTTTVRFVPVAVNTASGVSALFGKTVVAVAAGAHHSLAVCWDGTVAAWGSNGSGQLGDNTTTLHLVPVAVNATPLAAGERFTRVFSGSGASHTLAVVAAAPPEINVTGNGVSILNGDTTPRTEDGTDFGSAVAGGGTVVRTFMVQNTGRVALNLTGTPRVAVSGPQATNFTVTLQPASPVAGGGTTTFQVAFAPSASGTRTATLSIANDDSDESLFSFVIQGAGSGAVLDATYTTGSEVPLTVSGLVATGITVNFTLNYAPAAGTELLVVSNTGLNFINGTFDNLTNGQPVALSYGGTNYSFVANYHGGSGNDLMLVWANNRAFAWGWNNIGQLGDGTSGTNRLLGVPVTATGVLAGKTVVAVAAGNLHSLALCSDATVAAWGSNGSGQLGDNTTTKSLVPVAVNTASGVSALFGKTVVAVAAGASHSLALCSDGTVAAWGRNAPGQLGDNTTTTRLVPVAVNTASGVSALFGKTVVAVAAGASHSLALCSDGTVAAWGGNGPGQLGDNTTTTRLVPVAVNTASGVSALYGKTVVAIAAGLSHSLALCSDGTVAAWGSNDVGQLGNNQVSGGFSLVPVAVNMTSGVSALYGKTVVAIAAGLSHSLALCSDGTVAAWGLNNSGQLGNNATSDNPVPVAVNTASGVSALFGKTAVAIAAGAIHSLALCSDGTVTAWGSNGSGQLGDNQVSGGFSLVPVAVNTTSLAVGERFTCVSSGPLANHTLGLVAVPPGSDIILTDARELPNGSFQFAFTNSLGSTFTVLATTNVSLPLSTWTALGGATEVSPGHFQFTDPQAFNYRQRFYRVRSGLTTGITPLVLTGGVKLVSGVFQFAFTNTSGAVFTVLAATNPALPLSNWTVLGGVTEVTPGQFQFTDPQATNTPQRFYRVRSP
jgi:alpha-tubulin suppressor-like RCC1 family protein